MPPPDHSDPGADTDPAVADTQSSDGGTTSEGPKARSGETAIRAKRSVRAGDLLGRYELVEEVGEGGMATVFRAKDRELRREVAVKVLFPHLARRDEVVRRFHREARAAAGLEHPNILRVYDVGGGEEDDPPYIVMELIRGRTLLAEIEQRGPMLAEVVACIGALLADALVAAHAAGIIHRDIKPANVLIDPGGRSESAALHFRPGDRSESAPLHFRPGGRLLLADFGVARLETEDSLVTRTGSLLGTPAYMSPEQAGGDTATAKSDLYSLGATLYQLSTGTLPYTGSAARVMTQIAQGALVAPVRKRAAVGPDLSRVIERAMAVDAVDRPANAVALGAELRAIAAAGGLGEPKHELAAYFADPDAFVRERTPGVVTALVAAATQAIENDKLPRAMALADRASALAPADPSVVALIQTVTEGGRGARRRRVLALAGLGVLVTGGAIGGVLVLGGHHEHVPADAAIVIDARPIDAGLGHDDSALLEPVDAARGIDAGLRIRRADAAIVMATPVDATLPMIDAAPLVVIAPDAAQEKGAIVVKNDTWCDVSIDGAGHGRNRDAPIPIDAGRHTVVCEHPGTTLRWSQQVDVAPGKTITVSGKLLGLVTVTLAIDVEIDGIAHRRGESLELSIGQHALLAGGTKRYRTVRAPCTIRRTDDELDCYP